MAEAWGRRLLVGKAEEARKGFSVISFRSLTGKRTAIKSSKPQSFFLAQHHKNERRGRRGGRERANQTCFNIEKLIKTLHIIETLFIWSDDGGDLVSFDLNWSGNVKLHDHEHSSF
jgi:hypothetical protein